MAVPRCHTLSRAEFRRDTSGVGAQWDLVAGWVPLLLWTIYIWTDALLERLPYLILLVNILGASRRLLDGATTPVVQPPAGAIDVSVYKTAKTSATSVSRT